MVRWVSAVAIPLLGALVVDACSSSQEAVPNQATSCLLKSDCTSPLVCVLGVCHQECAETSDCPAMQHCRKLTARGYNGCVADDEFRCVYNSDCRDLLKCSVDGQCRSECVTSVDCLKGQTCDVVRDIGVCVDPSEISLATGHLVDRNVGGPPPVIAPDAAETGEVGPVVSEGGNDGSDDQDASPTITEAGTDAHDATADKVASEGGLPFVPSILDPALVDLGTAVDKTDSLGNAAVSGIVMNDNATLADLYVAKNLVVNATSTLRISGTRPVIIVVQDRVDIQGTVIVEAGGFFSTTAAGPGAGNGGLGSAIFPNSGGGGGSYCGVGGLGAGAGPALAPGGSVYGDPTLRPLRGGSLGGGGGVGGGAVAIIAGTSINVRQYASINAGGYASLSNPVGGGSGGAILLEAPVVTIAGNVTANGAGGSGNGMIGTAGTADDRPAPGGGAANDAGAMTAIGGSGSAGMTINGGDGVSANGTSQAGGGGGAGRIRLNTMSGSASVTGIVSPSFATPCATQGTLGH